MRNHRAICFLLSRNRLNRQFRITVNFRFTAFLLLGGFPAGRERGEDVTPNPIVPLGTKGAGESDCIGAPPAIANAVWDALAGHDRTDLQLPFTPDPPPCGGAGEPRRRTRGTGTFPSLVDHQIRGRTGGAERRRQLH
jgi:hypothetical protein